MSSNKNNPASSMQQKLAHDATKALKLLSLPESAKVLDVGTGEGNFAIYLASKGFKY